MMLLAIRLRVAIQMNGRDGQRIPMTDIMVTVPMTRKAKACKMDKYVNYQKLMICRIGAQQDMHVLEIRMNSKTYMKE